MKHLITILLLFIVTNIYAQVPDYLIPVITINTINNEMPTCTVVNAPEGCLGVSITNNDYVPGRMTLTYKDELLYDSEEYEKSLSGARIKIRGNSTGAYLDQHPYKIKLSKKFDLLRRGNDSYKHKEWLLLPMYTWNIKMTNQQSNILHIAGLTISKIVGMQWTPEYDFLHMVLNGEYQGMYYLMEPVSRGDQRVNIDKTGFLIEHDTFWWNEDVYFRTNYQTNTYAYTYKYPDSDDVTEDIQNSMITYMNEIEKAIYEDGDIINYIDIESFAKWMIVHDILGTDDAVGCNRYLYRNNNTSLLQMGPTWDYDSTFRSDSWSTIHFFTPFYYPELFKNETFVQTYLNIWKQIRPTIIDNIQSYLDEAYIKYKDVFDESIAIHNTKFPNEGMNSFQSQISEVKEKLIERIALLDNLIKQYDNNTAILETTNKATFRDYYVDIQGRRIDKKNKNLLFNGFYIIQNKDGYYQKIIKK